MPILLTNVLQSLNGSVNSVWIGRYLGEAALTASSTANMVFSLLLGGLLALLPISMESIDFGIMYLAMRPAR